MLNFLKNIPNTLLMLVIVIAAIAQWYILATWYPILFP